MGCSTGRLVLGSALEGLTPHPVSSQRMPSPGVRGPPPLPHCNVTPGIVFQSVHLHIHDNANAGKDSIGPLSRMRKLRHRDLGFHILLVVWPS